MPHQCLGCGKAFENGSTQLLKGCPDCKGTRFFYTDKPLDEAGRAAKAQAAKGDLRDVLEAMAKESKLDAGALLSGKSFDDWVKLDPRAMPAGPAAAQAAQAPAPSTPGAATLPATEPAPQPEPSDRPIGTVQVHEPGSYTLDVERLLAAKPIVIEKEGVYMIHLASAFEAPRDGAPPLRRKHR